MSDTPEIPYIPSEWGNHQDPKPRREIETAAMQRAEPEVTDEMLDAVQSAQQFLDCDCIVNKHTDECRRNHLRVLIEVALTVRSKPADNP